MRLALGLFENILFLIHLLGEIAKKFVFVFTKTAKLGHNERLLNGSIQ